jgi:hypothetical protein
LATGIAASNVDVRAWISLAAFLRAISLILRLNDLGLGFELTGDIEELLPGDWVLRSICQLAALKGVLPETVRLLSHGPQNSHRLVSLRTIRAAGVRD